MQKKAQAYQKKFSKCLKIIYMYKVKSALNNLEGVICHKNQPTKRA